MYNFLVKELAFIYKAKSIRVIEYIITYDRVVKMYNRKKSKQM